MSHVAGSLWSWFSNASAHFSELSETSPSVESSAWNPSPHEYFSTGQTDHAIARVKREQLGYFAKPETFYDITDKLYRDTISQLKKDKKVTDPEQRTRAMFAAIDHSPMKQLQKRQGDSLEALRSAQRDEKKAHYMQQSFRAVSPLLDDPVAFHQFFATQKKSTSDQSTALSVKMAPMKTELDKLEEERKSLFENRNLAPDVLQAKLTQIDDRYRKTAQRYFPLLDQVENIALKQQAHDELQADIKKNLFNKTSDVRHDQVIFYRDNLALKVQKTGMQVEKCDTNLTIDTEHIKRQYELLNAIRDGKPLSDMDVLRVEVYLDQARLNARKPVQERATRAASAIAQFDKNGMKALKLAPDKPKNQWPKNFTVSAPAGQHDVSWGSVYWDRVLSELNNTTSMPDAIARAEGKGSIHTINKPMDMGPLDIGRTVSYETPISMDRTIDQWRKPVPGKPDGTKRQILYIQGIEKNPEELTWFDSDYDNFAKTIRAQYGDSVVITRIKPRTPEEVTKAFDQLAKQVDKDSEVMVVLRGHGCTSGLEDGIGIEDEFREGSMVGNFWIDGSPVKNGKRVDPDKKDVFFTETFLKNEVKKISHARSGLILVGACHSGAWIAQGPQPTHKDPIG